MPFASGGTNNYLRTSFRSVKYRLRGVHIHYWLDMSRGTSTTSRMKCEPWSKESGLSWRTSCRRRDRRDRIKRAAWSEDAGAMYLTRGGTGIVGVEQK